MPGQNHNHSFTFRGRKDLGVLSHLCKEGYHISGSPERPIVKILDCGANIGVETLRFRWHHPKAEIIAVEADPANALVLKSNFEKDSLTTIVEGAVWHEDAMLKVRQSVDGNPEGSWVTEEDSGGSSVKAFSVPSLMSLRGWQTIDIVKLDIEGAEYHLFQEDTSWLSKVSALIFEIPDTDHPGTLQLIFEKLRGSKWNGLACGENLILIRDGVPWQASRVIGVRNSADAGQK
jgi:FkbM family methyltransferase